MKRIRLYVFQIIFFLVISFFLTNYSQPFGLISEDSDQVRVNLTPHPSILINSEDDWVTYSFPGNGTHDNPYLIENYEIITSSYMGIRIENVPQHFRIKNCFIRADSRGVQLYNTSDGVEVDSVIIDVIARIGIRVMYTDNVSITNCISVNGGLNQGIVITGHNSIVVNNSISGHHVGISVTGNNALICNNTVNSNVYAGIISDDGDYNQIYNNTCKFNPTGIYVLRTSYTNVYNNTCSFNGENGTRLDTAHESNVYFNWLEANGLFGVVLAYDSTNVQVYQNVFIDNAGGTSQAYHEGPSNVTGHNYWYNTITQTGNYWSDWNGVGYYEIDGNAQSADLYPLLSFGDLPAIPELEKPILLVFMIIPLSVILLVRKKRAEKV